MQHTDEIVLFSELLELLELASSKFLLTVGTDSLHIVTRNDIIRELRSAANVMDNRYSVNFLDYYPTDNQHVDSFVNGDSNRLFCIVQAIRTGLFCTWLKLTTRLTMEFWPVIGRLPG